MELEIKFDNMIANAAYSRYPINLDFFVVLNPNGRYNISFELINPNSNESRKFLNDVCNGDIDIYNEYYSGLSHILLDEICQIEEIIHVFDGITDLSLETIKDILINFCNKKFLSCTQKLFSRVELIYIDIGMREHNNISNKNLRFLLGDETSNESITLTPYGLSFAYKHFK